MTPLSEASSPVSEHNKSPITIPFDVLFHLKFHRVRMKEALNIVDGFIEQRIPRQITFSNAHTIALTWKDRQLQNIINRSDLNLADGMSIVWGGRMLDLKTPERVAGPDVMAELCARAELRGYKVFIMGSSPENLEKLKSVIYTRWPRIQLVGFHSPPMCAEIDEKETDIIASKLHAVNPDILFVGISCPKQEKWIAKNIQVLDVPVCLAVGAAFDFLSERIPRAPEWLQKRGLEWLFRLWCDPKRLWKRYLLGNAIFLSLLLKELAKKKLLGHSRKPIVENAAAHSK